MCQFAMGSVIVVIFWFLNELELEIVVIVWFLNELELEPELELEGFLDGLIRDLPDEFPDLGVIDFGEFEAHSSSEDETS